MLVMESALAVSARARAWGSELARSLMWDTARVREITKELLTCISLCITLKASIFKAITNCACTHPGCAFLTEVEVQAGRYRCS